jgi:glycosyltransferase involved in cell wall biosynthesis
MTAMKAACALSPEASTRKLRVATADAASGREVCGRVGTDFAAHHASADMFNYPSLTEIYGNVTVEALASGVRVVVTEFEGALVHLTDEHARGKNARATA